MMPMTGERNIMEKEVVDGKGNGVHGWTFFSMKA